MEKIILPTSLDGKKPYLSRTPTKLKEVHIAVWGKVDGMELTLDTPTGFPYDNIRIKLVLTILKI